MGQGISSEQVAAHLARQSDLIAQLQEIVDKQAKAIETAATKHIDYSADGATNTTAAVPASLRDELEILPSEARASENAKREMPITAEELEAPDIEWVEPTEAEEKRLGVTKPWLVAMAPPKNFEFGKTDAAPSVSLQLEHVYGYRASGARNTAFWVDAKTIVYYVGSIGISLNVETNKQTFFTHHVDTICSIAVDRKRKIVATGESGRFPAIYVWNAITGEMLAKIAGRHRRAVTALSFGRDGSVLASVGIDDSHTLLMVEWESGKVVAEGSCKARVLDIAPNFTAGHNPNTDFVTVGEGQVTFWTTSKVPSGSPIAAPLAAAGIKGQQGAAASTSTNTSSDVSVSITAGKLGNLGVKQHFLCVRTTRTHTLVGCANGQLYAFRDDKLVYAVSCHQGPIHSLQVVAVSGEADVFGDSATADALGMSTSTNSTAAADKKLSTAVFPEVRLFTAGRDGFISCWDIDTRCREVSINLNKETCEGLLKHGTNAVRTMDVLLTPPAKTSDGSETASGASPTGGAAALSLRALRKSGASSTAAFGGKILVGTINGTLATCNAVDGSDYTTITAGHCADLSSPGALEGELWGLASCPVTNRFATCGEDAVLRLYDSDSHAQISFIELPRAAQCLAFSRDGLSIAVGFLNGTIGIFSVSQNGDATIAEVCEMRRCARRIQCIQFSPCGNLLGAGTADGNVDLYEIKEGPIVDGGNSANKAAALDYLLKLRLASSNNSVCMRFDFSKDGKYVQACSQSYELLFYDLTRVPKESGGVPASPSAAAGRGANAIAAVPQVLPLSVKESRQAMADVEWATYTSFLGWSVQGVWLSSHADGTDINAVRRSHNGKYLLAGCDSGHVRLFSYPCVGSGLDRNGFLARRPASKALLGHGKHISEVEWSADDKKVFSISASDRCSMQWRVVEEDGQQ